MHKTTTERFRKRKPLAYSVMFSLTGVALIAHGFFANAENVQKKIEPLLQYPNVNLWPGGQVPVCFNGRANSLEAAWLKSALEHTWSAVANIDFQYADTCPFPNKTNHFQIDWFADTNWGIGGTSGTGMGSPTVVVLGYCSAGDCNPGEYEEAFKSVAAHEIGHGLGFAHEHQRDDRKPPADCIRSEPQRADYTTDRDYQEAHGAWVANYALITDGIKLSESYDADSIMNYCRGLTATTITPLVYQEGYQASDRLSVGDLHGAQKVYGIRMPYWLILPNL